MAGQENSKLIAVNRKARHDYFVMEAMEAGVAAGDRIVVDGMQKIGEGSKVVWR